mgnify:CR=1 FL=1
MPNPPPASKRFTLHDTRHNVLMQVADFSCICLSVAVVVSMYPAAKMLAVVHNSAAALGGVLFCLAATAHGLYKIRWLRRPAADEVKAILVCWAWTVAPLMTLGFATKMLTNFSRVATVSWILLAPSLIVIYRLLARAGSQAGRSAPRRAAIAGVTPFGEHIHDTIQRAPDLGLSMVGLFDDRSSARDESMGMRLTSAGSFQQLVAAARDGTVDVVYVALPLRAEDRVRELILRLQDTTASVYIAFDFDSLAGSCNRQISHVGNMPVVPLLAPAQPSVRTQALTFVRALTGPRTAPRDLPRTAAPRTSKSFRRVPGITPEPRIDLPRPRTDS